ncbi:hypothetical protein PG988_006527 [Apiospora saccharicola]
MNDVGAHLSKHLRTPVLELCLVAKKSGVSVDLLHTQKVRGRIIVSTQDPSLHLVWNLDKIYIKPVPEFLLNHGFWLMYLQNTDQGPTSRVSQEPSQFQPPTSNHSLDCNRLPAIVRLTNTESSRFRVDGGKPLYAQGINWLEWSGSLVISDTNKITKLQSVIIMGSCVFHGYIGLSGFLRDPSWSITEFVERATIPLLFVFASVSLVLSSMQVVLSVPVDDLWYEDSNKPFLRQVSRAFWVFSIVVLLLGGMMWMLFLVFPAIGLL